MNSAMAHPIRQYLMNRSRLLSAVRLPNNLFTDYAGTEVGSDLILLQKDTLSQREYTPLEHAFVEVGTQADGTTQNEYFERTAAIVHTRGMSVPIPTVSRHASTCMTGAWSHRRRHEVFP